MLLLHWSLGLRRGPALFWYFQRQRLPSVSFDADAMQRRQKRCVTCGGGGEERRVNSDIRDEGVGKDRGEGIPSTRKEPRANPHFAPSRPAPAPYPLPLPSLQFLFWDFGIKVFAFFGNCEKNTNLFLNSLRFPLGLGVEIGLKGLRGPLLLG